MAAGTPEQRRTREQRRILFDGVAARYDVTRQGYPAEITDAVLANAAISPGAAVLEIGCGTGQLTRQLAGRALNLTAIDIGAAMVQAARRNVADAGVRFEVCSFEDFTGSGPFDLIVSGTAFHWVDPGVGLAKAARLLRPGGWLALLTTGERYPEPLQAMLRELWIRYSRQRGKWDGQPRWLTALRQTRLFGQTIEANPNHSRALRLPVETVIGVERTRATFLSYAEQDQADFTADLAALLAPGTQIDLIQETFLAMAPAV
ncbi:MAG: class I SAM-dependent methyltransferase [Actinobacteria bacterium]|nr:class I SAM-dependent methyltransferase [Actinomycetota bacterium]